MNYVYDILTNFNEVLYDFYEWEKKDNITHIKKIPIIKIDKNDFNKLVSYQFQIDNDYLKKIKNKTEIWSNRNNDNYYSLITNGTDIIGIEFNEQGKSIKRSSLIVDEELDTLQTIRKLDQTPLNFKLLNKINNSFITRKEIKSKNFLIQEINKLSTTNDTKKINYLYYECFNKIEPNLNKALSKIAKSIENKNIFNILYDFFNLTKTSNK